MFLSGSAAVSSAFTSWVDTVTKHCEILCNILPFLLLRGRKWNEKTDCSDQVGNEGLKNLPQYPDIWIFLEQKQEVFQQERKQKSTISDY